MGDTFSLLNLVKTGGYDASLITTYAVNLQVYEQLVLRRLMSGGCRYNVLVVDYHQLATMWASRELRPEVAGIAYTLFPVRMSGAFHPKIWFLAGRKKAALLVGSHNMTLAGLGYNRELSALIELNTEPDLELDGACRDAWDALKTWVERCEGQLPRKLSDAVYRFEEFLRPFLRPPGKEPTVEFHSHGITTAGLLQTIGSNLSDDIKRIAVLGPYVDSRFEFLQALRERWPSARIFFAVTPEALGSTDVLKIPHIHCVDARLIGGEDGAGFFHAKAIYIEGRRGTRILAVGSANPSAPAWIRTDAQSNAEAMLVLRGRRAQQNAEEIGIPGLFQLPRLKPNSIQVGPSAEQEGAPNSNIQALVAVASIDQASRTIELVLNGGLKAIRYALRASNDTVLYEGPLLKQGAISLQVPDAVNISALRSVEIQLGDGAVLTAWIHDAGEIERLASASVKVQVKRALAALTGDDGNLAQVLDAIQKVVFEDDEGFVGISVTTSAQRKKKDTGGCERQPDSLAVDVADIARHTKRIRVLKSGDLAYLIDVLMRRLAIDSIAPSDSTDRLGRSEEEQIGTEDDTPGGADKASTRATLPDNEMAALIGRKVKNLVKRLLQYLEQTAGDKQHVARAVARIIAVLALLRELRRIEASPRWRMVRLKLVPREPREELFKLAVEYLLGEKHALLEEFERLAGARTEEGGQARALLAWLAWDIGDEYTERFSLALEPEEVEQRLEANAALFALLPSVVSDDGELSVIEDSLALTRPTALPARDRQRAWLDRHVQLGNRWRKLWAKPVMSFPRKRQLQLGDIAIVVSAANPRPRIVTEIGDGHVGLSTLGGVVRFQRDRIVSLQV